MKRSANLLLIAAATYTFFFATIGMGSVIARYARDLGLSVTEATLIYSVTPLTAALLRIPFGVIADRIGSREVMALGGLFAFVAGLIAAHSKAATGLALARAMQGIALAAYVAPSITVAGQLTGVPVDRAISVRSASISAASSTAPAIVAFAVDTLGYHGGFILSAVVGASSTVLSFSLKVEKRSVREGSWTIGAALRASASIAPLLVASGADGLVFFAVQSLPQVHLRDLGYSATVFGMALTVNGVTGFFARLTAPRVAERLSPFGTMYLGYVMAATGLTILALNPRPPSVYLAFALYGSGLGLVVPMEQLLIVTYTPANVRATVTSLYALAFDISGVAGSAGYGILAEHVGYNTAYQMMAANELLAISFVALFARRVSHTRGHHGLSIATRHHAGQA